MYLTFLKASVTYLEEIPAKLWRQFPL